MALEDIMDAVAIAAKDGLATADATTGLPGLKECYSAAASSTPSTLVPRSVDDWPVGFVLPGGSSDPDATNYEQELHDLTLDIWVNASDIGYAVRTLVPFATRCKVLYRGDITKGGTAQRVLYRGYGALEPEEAHNAPWLVLPVRLEAFELTVGGSLYST